MVSDFFLLHNNNNNKNNNIINSSHISLIKKAVNMALNLLSAMRSVANNNSSAGRKRVVKQMTK